MRIGLLAGVIGAGLLSRQIQTGAALLDKYLGDALYAVMIYLLLPIERIGVRAAASMMLMGVIEGFQLTGIPAEIASSEVTVWRLMGRLLGTVFSWADLFAYATGIAVIGGWDWREFTRVKQRRDVPMDGIG